MPSSARTAAPGQATWSSFPRARLRSTCSRATPTAATSFVPSCKPCPQLRAAMRARRFQNETVVSHPEARVAQTRPETARDGDAPLGARDRGRLRRAVGAEHEIVTRAADRFGVADVGADGLGAGVAVLVEGED